MTHGWGGISALNRSFLLLFLLSIFLVLLILWVRISRSTMMSQAQFLIEYEPVEGLHVSMVNEMTSIEVKGSVKPNF